MNKQLASGTKPHVHPTGSESTFSKIHRSLGRTLPMTDIDFLIGNVRVGATSHHFHHDGEQTQFVEYKSSYGEMNITALFDVKHNMTSYIKESLDNIRTGTAIWAQAELANKLNTKFFVVVESNGKVPLQFIEIVNGKAVHRGTLTDTSPGAVVNFWCEKLRINP